MTSAFFSPLPSPVSAPAPRLTPRSGWTPLPSPETKMANSVLTAPTLPAFPSLPASNGSHPPAPVSRTGHPIFHSASSAVPDFTDADLFEALNPFFQETLGSSGFGRDSGIDEILEPMLRATIRRALAEYSPASRPFQGPGSMDRLVWHLQALFTSRTYEDVVFEKTHRFQVEEVFLVDASSLALVSYASCDPARHGSPKRVTNTVHRLSMQLRHDDGSLRDSFELPDQRNAVCCQGQHVILVAIVRGHVNDLLLTDIEFSLKRIEDRFREKFQEPGSALLRTLQPFLEDCLLIQAPASAA
jgi:hypothetical protein